MRRNWTKREEQYLIRCYTKQPVEITAKKLNRTKQSVKKKARKLGLNAYTDNLSAKVVAQCFGLDISVVIRWINKFNLPADTIKCYNQTRYNIDVDKFWKWAEENKDMINWTRYQINSLPPEPEWVKNQKNNYVFINHHRKFTYLEKQNIRRMLKENSTYGEISQKAGRTVYSITHAMKNGVIL